MSEEATNAAIVGRIMRTIEMHDRIRPDMRGNHLESIENMLHGALGEKDAEIARLKDEHHAVCRGLAESILIIVRKLADRDRMIDRLICYADHDDARDANGVPEQSGDLATLLAECRAAISR